MAGRRFFVIFSVVVCLAMTGCSADKQSQLVVDAGSVPAGTKVTRKGQEIDLLGTPVATGMKIPATDLIDATTMQEMDLSDRATLLTAIATSRGASPSSR